MRSRVRELMRQELTQFERWVLLQILDHAWKDHLRAMDGIRDAIGFRAFSQKDPRIEFKKEAAKLFEEMNEGVRDKVTDVIFKGRLQPQAVQRPAPPAPAAVLTPQAGDAPGAEGAEAGAAQATPSGPLPSAEPAPTARQQRELEQAERAGTPQAASPMRRAAAPVRSVATVGRNEPCPCGSGKKFKQCHGKK